MMTFVFVAGLVAGGISGTVVMACLSAGAYNKGYGDAKNER